MTDLNFLPCMCCGSNRIIHFKTSKNRGYATCINCGMRTRGCGNYENKDDLKWRERATILWNTRAPIDNIVEKLEEAKSLVNVNRLLDDIINNKPKELGQLMAYTKAINIVKQEINNGENNT